MKLFHTLIALSLSALTFTACDEVDSDKRFSGPITVEAKKNVLIEDFTGQKCINCPKAANEIARLQQVCGERLIAVSIHGGSLSLSETKTPAGLANAQGDDYVSHWGVNSFPKGRVDRSGSLLDYEQWGALAVKRLGVEPKVEITITPTAPVDANSTSVAFNVDVKGLDNAQGKLQVWLTESQIKNMQFMPDGSRNADYVHNHVFRASVSAPYGDDMTVVKDKTESKSYTYSFPDFSQLKNTTPWNPTHMAIVAFFYNETDGVMQVVDCKLVGNAAE